MLDDLLKKFGLKYEDLIEEERETINSWIGALEQNALTLEKVREFIRSMRDSVEDELTKTGFNSKQDLFLKARLRNYKLIEALLDSPEKAKKALERSLAGIVPRK